jgi:alpha-glucoside transport system permease protein
MTTPTATDDTFDNGRPVERKRYRLPITGNAFAVLLTVLIVLPAAAFALFAVTSIVDTLLVSLPAFEADEFGRATENQALFITLSRIAFAIRAILIAVALSFGYYAFASWLNLAGSRVMSRSLQGRNSVVEAIQPWIFVGPAVVLLSLFLVYPTLETFRLSFVGEAGYSFENYIFIFNSNQFWIAIRNSVLWLAVVPTACVLLGLVIAVLADSVRWGVVAKTFIFVPLAISFVGAAVIWRNIYASGGIEATDVTPGFQLGLLNAILGRSADDGLFFYELQFWGNFFMMTILIWIQTGFAMVIFSAALRGVPEDTLEAARLEGANPFQIFTRVQVPQIYSTIVVVWTTITILVLKVFDIPYALTANKDDKLLLATYMRVVQDKFRDENQAAAIAIILMLTVVPIMAFNIWRLRQDQA